MNDSNGSFLGLSKRTLIICVVVPIIIGILAYLKTKEQPNIFTLLLLVVWMVCLSKLIQSFVLKIRKGKENKKK